MRLEESLAGTLAELYGLLHEGIGVVAEAGSGERSGNLGASRGVEEDLAGDTSELGSRVPRALDVGQHVGAAVGVDLSGQLAGEGGVRACGGLVGNVLQVNNDFGEVEAGERLAGLGKVALAKSLGSKGAESVQVVGLVVLQVTGVNGVAGDTWVAGVGSSKVKEGGDALHVVGVGLDGLLDLALVWWGQLGAEGRRATSGKDSCWESGTSTAERSRKALGVGNIARSSVALVRREGSRWCRTTRLGDLTSNAGRPRTRLRSSLRRVSVSALVVVATAMMTTTTTTVVTEEPTRRRRHRASGSEDNSDS